MRIQLCVRFAWFGLLAGVAAAPLAAQESRQLLETPALTPAAHVRLRLHAGEYHVEASKDGRMHVTETRDAAGSAKRATDVTFHETKQGATVEIEPPLNNHGETRITIALPPCAALDLNLTAGELVFDRVPCEATEVSIHTGELRAALGDGDAYRSVRGSVTIGEVDARALGATQGDESHGGFFRSVERNGKGTRSFAAHIGSGQITLEGKQE